MRGILLAIVIMLTAIDAAARGLIPRGRYEIAVAQEGAKTKQSAEPIKIEECITKSRIISAQAFHARSGHPVAQCPITDVRFNGEELLFRIECAGTNAARAKAKFLHTRDGYEGTITIDADGKKIIEHQRARRIGECAGDHTDSNVVIDEMHWRGEPLRATPQGEN